MGRLVIVARKLDPGGAERQLVSLASGLKERGHAVYVVLFYGGGVFDEDLEKAGIETYCLGKRNRWDVIGFLLRLAATLRRLHPDVIYSFLDLPNILAVVFRKIAGARRLAWSVRAAGMEMQHYDWLFRAIPWVESRLSGLADVIIANSYAGSAWAASRGFPADRLRVVENGIAVGRFRPDSGARARVRAEWNVADEDRIIGLVGRFDPMKDHPNFISACATLAVTQENLRFACIGAGSNAYRAELAELAGRYGIAERMIWSDARQDMPSVYSALDMACSASAFGEGFSNVIGEAMSCGVPCVVTDVGDSARIVGELGEVVPPRDAKALAKAMERMLQRIKREPDIGRRVRERIEVEFSLEKMLSRTENILFGPA